MRLTDSTTATDFVDTITNILKMVEITVILKTINRMDIVNENIKNKENSLIIRFMIKFVLKSSIDMNSYHHCSISVFSIFLFFPFQINLFFNSKFDLMNCSKKSSIFWSCFY